MKNKLKREFYLRDVQIVAKDLLGKLFVFENKKEKIKLIGEIVETEAYDGRIDEAAHSFIGKTERNKIMFEEGGKLYVYFIYGVHHCLNIVTGNEGIGCAVLIRAMKPIKGINYLAKNRFGVRNPTQNQLLNLLNGPGKICKAFGIDKTQNGFDLMGDNIYLLNNKKYEDQHIVTTKRIGIKKSTELLWRYYLKDNQYVSKR